ncbi:MAG: REP-associated tyrosine transposase [Verrucomicrobiota bacterium]|jgi:REP element-mobilizing transposase RayT
MDFIKIMARQLRVEYEGAIYHVLNRGDRREPIFKADVDRRSFLETLGETCLRTDWQVHAYCLMSNHFHLVIETPQANLATGMKWFLGTYTSRFNRRHKLSGHLFSGRYKSMVVDGSGDGYLRTVCDYVHLNPVRAKLLTADQPLRNFPWSSYCEYLKAPAGRPGWLRVDRLLGEMAIPKDSAAGRRQFAQSMEDRRGQVAGDDWRALRRGWYLGDQEFRDELLAQTHERSGVHHFGQQRRETAEHKAARLLDAELRTRGWTEEDLAGHRKGDSEKIQMARHLRRHSSVPLKWIATRLRMGSGTYVANLLGMESKRNSSNSRD